MNVTYQFLVYANVLGESTHTIKNISVERFEKIRMG
jgi:hypothetical protein